MPQSRPLAPPDKAPSHRRSGRSPLCSRTCAVKTAAECFHFGVVALIALHQAERRGIEVEADLRLGLLPPLCIDEAYAVTGRRPAHRAQLHTLAGEIADLRMNTLAPAFHGAKKQLQACFAQPGDEMLRWMSSGRTPSQYIVDRWPTG
jgi:hypothetical protein